MTRRHPVRSAAVAVLLTGIMAAYVSCALALVVGVVALPLALLHWILP